MNLYSKEEARHMLCRYHNFDGAEALSGKAGAEKIMQRIHSIQYDPLNVVARNADLVLQARVNDYKEPVLYNGQFVARFEAEPVRQTGEFVIKNWWWEPGIEPTDDMIEMIVKEMERFAEFLQTNNSPNNIKKLGVE